MTSKVGSERVIGGESCSKSFKGPEKGVHGSEGAMRL